MCLPLQLSVNLLCTLSRLARTLHVHIYDVWNIHIAENLLKITAPFVNSKVTRQRMLYICTVMRKYYLFGGHHQFPYNIIGYMVKYCMSYRLSEHM